MDAGDLQVRNATYALFVQQGRAPSAAEVAASMALAEPAVEAAWSRLHDAHALVLDASRRSLRMANPFSAVPTPYRVTAAGRTWFGNCAWDAFGICAALDCDGTINTVCPDCGGPLTIEVAGGRPDRSDLLFHCLVPARQWWDDIAFT